MKNYLLLFLLIAISSATFAQITPGSYNAKQQSLVFNNDSVKYNLYSGAGIVTQHKGIGTYVIKHHRIFITPVFPKQEEPIVEIQPGSGDRLYIRVTNKIPVVGASVAIYRAGKFIMGASVTILGTATFNRDKLMDQDSVRVSFIGMIPVHFRYMSNNDYHVTMREGIPNEVDRTFITNHNKGYKIKINRDSIAVQLPKLNVFNHKMSWVQFVKSPDQTNNQ